MPTYDYRCADCGNVFEGFVWRDERPGCPACESERTDRQFSPPQSSTPAAPVARKRTPEPEVAAETVVEAAAPQVERVDRVRPEPRPEPARDPLDRTLRRDAPELWDLERDFERRQAGQLVEISEKSQRLVKLMERIEALEPLLDEIAGRDREIQRLNETVHTLQETGRTVASKLEERTRALEQATAEAAALRVQIGQADEEARQRALELDALQLQGEQERTGLAGQIAERDQQLDAAHARQFTLEAELQERIRQVEDVTHGRDSVKAELESRTLALFKRDELIQAADEKLAELGEELRERDRRVADAHQRHERQQAELDARDAEIRSRDAAVRESEANRTRLGEELAAVRAELAGVNEALEASRSENRELSGAWASATGLVEEQRAKLQTSSNHLQLTQMLLDELKPMLLSLETTLTPEFEELEAALPRHEAETVENSND